MTWDKVAGKWKRLTGSIRKRWTHSPTKKDQLVAQIQERYRAAKTETHKRAERWSRALKESQR